MIVRSASLAVLAATALSAAGPAATLAAGIRIPDGPGANLVYAKCQACHDLQYVQDSSGLLPTQWAAVLASMQDYGLEISEPDKSRILSYLSTYLGQNPPPAPAPATASASRVDGATVWQESCAACHRAAGTGQAGYYPPLAGNPDLFASRSFPIQVVLHGISGPITVKGQDYNGSMPSFAHLSNAEIAAVVNFVRSSWGNDANSAAAQMKPVTPELVAQERQQAMSPAQVLAQRPQDK